MLQRGRWFLIACLSFLPCLPTQGEPATGATKNDLHGDPLPEGALTRLGTVRWRHGSVVSFVGFTQDGKQLITAASQDGVFRVWDMATGKELRRFGTPPSPANRTTTAVNNPFLIMEVNSNPPRVALSPDGQTFVAATFDGTIRVYEVATGKELRTMKATQSRGVASVGFSPDGKNLIVKGQMHQLHLWDVTTGKEVRTFGQQPGGRQVYVNAGANSASFSPDGKMLASGNMEMDNNNWISLVRIWDAATGTELRQIKGAQNGVPGSIHFTKDNKNLIWVGGDGTIHVHEAATGKELRQMAGPAKGGYVNSLALSPDGKVLASRSMNEPGIRLWDPDTGKELRAVGEQPKNAPGGAVMFWGGSNGGSQTLAFSPDGKAIAEGGSNNSVRLWDLTTNKELGVVGGHQGAVSSFVASADGKTITSWGADNTVRQWDSATGKELRQFSLYTGAMFASFTADGQRVAFASNTNMVYLWDVAAGKELRQLRIKDQQFAPWGTSINSLAFSLDGKLVAGRGWDQSVYIWDAQTGRELHVITNPAGANAMMFGGYYNTSITGLAFTPDSNYLVSVGPAIQTNVNANGPGMVVSSRQNQGTHITVYNVATGKQVRQVADQNRSVTAAAVTPDGRTLATANSNGTISLYELATGKERFQFKGNVICLAFDRDSRTLLGSGTDQIIHLWDVRDGRELGQFKGHEGSVLAVGFLPDGKRLISTSADTSLLVWDRAAMKGLPAGEAAQTEPKGVEALWSQLGSDDAKVAYGALWGLVDRAKEALPLLADKLRPVTPVESKRIEQLMGNLDHNAFSVREKATYELEKLGPLAEPALKTLLAGDLTFETRKRVERILEGLATGQPPPADTLRALRAVEVLEQIGTPEARQVLDALAKGAAGARLTQDARMAMDRLATRPPAKS